jgi:hypothetical protein
VAVAHGAATRNGSDSKKIARVGKFMGSKGILTLCIGFYKSMGTEMAK